jgi:uncharacterized membrane protein YphA (DoxX/SURF4 family)
MSFFLKLTRAHTVLSGLLDHFRTPALLATRLYIALVFWQSGTILGIVLASILTLGALTRVGALAALIPVALAGSETLSSAMSAAGPVLPASALLVVTPRMLLGFMLLVLTVSGPGAISVDARLERRLARLCRPFMAAPPA